MKQQKIVRSNPKTPTIIDERTINLPEASSTPSGIPVRAVVYVEVKDMSPMQMQHLLKKVAEGYANAKGGIHYIVPVRHGKITADILFEAEFLKVINELCEVVDGKICLKNGAQEVRVIRESV